MEAILTRSPSSDEAVKAEDPRADLKMILSRSSMYGGPLNEKNYTFCACCGSQYVTKDGKVGLSGLGEFLPVGAEALKKYFEKQYGTEWVRRIRCQADADGNFVAWGPDYDKRYIRVNKPGVTCAFMSLQDAINLLYTEDKRPLVEGYEINDKDQGGVVSILWMNA